MVEIDNIRKNFTEVISRFEQERGEAQELRVQLEKLRKELEDSRNQITDLKRQVDNLTLAGAFSSSAPDRTEAKVRIDRLIGEIDKCIGLLG